MSNEQEKPPAAMRHFLVGPDGRGRWIVCDAEGSCGAVFVDKDQALQFAKSECEAAARDGADLRFVPSLEWRSIFARPTKRVA